ncbi:hypothetical protein T4A_3574 [Trichinella pseudospiralis]|uniref:Uncharacterized protein n=1 Tax=Trichinella pseudospiralis TaxID=6337 RepID=A0A0V1E078_TRIPS|nr:hypothetical protein T4A_3574 [Trichinella pseudospiralis]KRY83012.1 hypothetical protein T4D_5932 [Trichinella pseudospiralis]
MYWTSAYGWQQCSLCKEKEALRWTLTSGQGDNCKLLHTVSGRPCSSIGANPPTVDDYLHFLYHSRPNEKREKNIK